MASRNPDFAALAEASYEAADIAVIHLEWCKQCIFTTCTKGKRLLSNYRRKRNKALESLRKAAPKPSVATDNETLVRRKKR